MERIPFELITEVPPITRYWSIGVVALAALEKYGFLSSLDLLYSFDSVFRNSQYWRLITTFFYFGSLNFDLFFVLFFMVRYSRSLEENISRSRDYLWILFINSVLLIIYSSFIYPLSKLGPKLQEAIIYIWSRRNPNVRLQLFGIIEFSAAYLPFFYAIFNHLLRQLPLRGTLVDIIIGHIYFYFQDIFPKIHGYYPFNPPWKWVWVQNRLNH
ncbi:derlin [Ascoidea rubescens DSM 1968]|uniref:Derlin n=1 Tax=Ascoidea rubescens DSM 1968 TaxID=1344418 RepID=A0A1D2VEF9_9ASCO|nr:Der1-like protein [Ascoidea rubescens DSM 1968]ODV60005.1 Der1-like protein [Ascoidea rubescens DSM 1968]